MSLSEYLTGGMARVEGWCSPHLWHAVQPIHLFQQARRFNNPVAEIGVHHGKLFIALVKTKETVGNHAFDCFDDQAQNIDQSGRGSLAIFRANLESHGVHEGQVVIHPGDSLALTPGEIADIRRETGGFSFFSVDGGHTAEHAQNDFVTAMALTHPLGTIIVDDWNNPNWPGVQEGISQLFFGSKPRYVPLVFCQNKLIFCHLTHHGRLLEHLVAHVRQHYPGDRAKVVTRFGYRSLTLDPDTSAAPL